MLYGLIGYPLGHSFSQKYFTEKFAREGIAGAQYELFPLPDITMLPGLLRAHPDLRGLNVTIPHKQAVLPYLDVLDETAAAVGAVNCIRIRAGRLEGFNTDVYGFERSCSANLQVGADPNRQPVGWRRSALILGTGGASKSVAFVLKKHGLDFKFVSRRPSGPDEISYASLAGALSPLPRLIVNTTPLGMAPNTDSCPDLPFERLGPEHLVYDLVYNPPETLLLQRAAARGCAVRNGLEMLHLQAEKAWDIWQQDDTP